jgi:iron complex transport system ATP-binding protein
MAAIHDLNLAAAICDQVIALREGRLFRTGAVAEVLTLAFIPDVFQVGRRSNTPSLHPWRARRGRVAAGQPPPPAFFPGISVPIS